MARCSFVLRTDQSLCRRVHSSVGRLPPDLRFRATERVSRQLWLNVGSSYRRGLVTALSQRRRKAALLARKPHDPSRGLLCNSSSEAARLDGARTEAHHDSPQDLILPEELFIFNPWFGEGRKESSSKLSSGMLKDWKSNF
eukprot:scaffold2114_cov253-Pinguiococcus_pyrenoidosus.AAC.13